MRSLDLLALVIGLVLTACQTRNYNPAHDVLMERQCGTDRGRVSGEVRACLEGRTFKVNSRLKDTSTLPFRSESSYLAMAIPFEPVDGLRAAVAQATSLNLKTRGEAHITVITPPEFSGALSHKLSMGEIEHIANEMNIQKARLDLVCLGGGEVTARRGADHNFFIVVRSEDLLAIRRRIAEEFVRRGGNPEAFSPDQFYPHVTVGFTKRDLHIQDCVIKSERSCVANLEFGEDRP